MARCSSLCKEPEYFQRVFVEDGVLTWPNGYDWDPIALHDEMNDAGELRPIGDAAEYVQAPTLGETSGRLSSFAHTAGFTTEGSYVSTLSAAMNASCGMSTFPYWRIFFLPSFCFSRSLRLRVASPP